MTNNPSNISTANFIATAKLLEFLEIFKGGQISSSQVDEISKGILDYFYGFIVAQNCTEGSDDLRQVQIRTSDGDFTLTDRKEVALNESIFDVIGNTYLINRPREIWISNLNIFREKFQEAARFNQMVACVYNRKDGKISLLRIISKDDFLQAFHGSNYSHNDNNYLKNKLASDGNPPDY